MARGLSDIFDRCKMDAQMQPYFDGGVVHSIAVSQDKKTMICHVAFAEIVPTDTLGALEKTIAACYALTRMRISPRYTMSGLTEPYLRSLRERLCIETPSACGLLADSEWTCKDGALQIAMSDAAREYLKLPLHSMAEHIRVETGQAIPVVAVPLDAQTAHDAHEAQRTARKEALAQAAKDCLLPNPEDKPKKPRSAPRAEAAPYQRPKAEKVADENLIFGKLYTDTPMPISDAMNELGQVTIRGDIFFVDHREIVSKKTGKEWIKLSFDITDNVSSVRVCRFMSKEQAEPVVPLLKTGAHVIVQGKVTFDTYEKESILEPTAIVKAKKVIRQDRAAKKRVELHVHTNMSAMDGICSPKALIDRASLWEHPAIAITDHGVAQAFPDAMHAVERGGLPIKVLYGVEAYYVNDAADLAVVRGTGDAPLSGEVIVFDVETTGLKPSTEAITEIAAVLVRDGQIIDSFQTYINPEKPIPAEITALTGITDDTVRDAPSLSAGLTQFLEFSGERPLVAHNAGFDMAFLYAACEKLGIKRAFTSIDTLEMSRILLPHLGRHRLNVLAKALGVGPFEHHRASEDAAVLARIWGKLIGKLQAEFHAVNISDINPLLAGLRAKSGSLKNLPRHHLIVLVKNQTGLKNLYKLISYSYLNHFYKKPLMPRSALIKHREGLIFGSACEAGELFQAMLRGADWAELKRIASFYDFLEIQPAANNRFMLAKGLAQDEEELRDFNRKILKLADETGKPCCATGDVHFLEPEDEAFRRILMAGQGFSDADNQAPLYLRTTDEMLDEFAYLGADRAYEVVVTNTNLIADACDVIRPVPRESFTPKMEGSDKELEDMCRKKAQEMYGDPLPEIVQARLDRELKSIIGNGYDVMYMIAQKLVAKSLADGYLVGSRGSVGSSLVAFLAGITEVNSLAPHYLCTSCKYAEFHENVGVGSGVCLPDKCCPSCGAELTKEGFSVPFETFLGFEGDKVPDIDLNFSGEYQARIHEYTAELFGKDHVFRAGTIGTIAEKTAYGYVKKYMEERGITCSRAEENRLTAGCTGVRRTSGQHPGGIVVVPKDVEIYDFCPVQHPADDPESGVITTHFEYHSIDENLLKLDELGHDDPTIIRHLEMLTGVDATKIPLDDPAVMSLFTSNAALRYSSDKPDPILDDIGCLAVPEFGTKFVRGMVRDTQPQTFDDLLCISGLSHGTDVWLGNASELVAQGIPLNECICCRDDIMNYLIAKGVQPKLSFTIMESVRKGKGLKPEWEDAMRQQNVPAWYIDSCKKIKYMFPKAHAVAYVMMAFRIAWFKVHHPLAFYAAYFTIRAKGFDASCMIKGDALCAEKIRELQQKERDKIITAAEKETAVTLEVVYEFYKRGFTFAPMDVYTADASTFLVTAGGLIPPLTAMPGVGEQAALSIVAEREQGPFLSAEEILVRCSKVSKSALEALDEIGALSSMPKSTQISLFA